MNSLDILSNNLDEYASALGTLSPLGALTIDMQEAIRRGNVERMVYSDGDAVLFLHRCGVYMLWCRTAQAGEHALDGLKSEDESYLGMVCCVAHGGAARQAVENKTKLHIERPCIQFCRYSKEKMPMKNIGTVRRLNIGDLPAVNEVYKLGSPAHNERAISEGLMYGLEIDGRLAAFIGMHSDGSVGMLEVLPAFRRRGLGTELESYMHNLHIDRGWIPYGHVYTDNDASMNMQNKFGLEGSSDRIWWTYRTDVDF